MVLLLLGLAYWEGREVGIAHAESLTLRAQKDTLRRRGDSLEKSFRVGTVKLTKTIRNRDSILALTGALDSAKSAIERLSGIPGARPETVTVRVPAQVLVQDDNTIRSCRETLSTCELGWANEKKLRLNAEDMLAVEKKKHTGVLSTWLWRVAGFELGRISAGKVP